MSEYITRITMIHDYNMTDALINKLGEPDKITKNPHYSSAAPMKLYLRERVEKWVEENPELIQKVIERRKKRPLKPIEETVTTPPIKAPPPPPRKHYRQNIRQVGDKWSWGVYQQAERKMVKSGWADSKEEAEELCRQAIKTEQLNVRKRIEEDYRY